MELKFGFEAVKFFITICKHRIELLLLLLLRLVQSQQRIAIQQV
jgi:hypothetical protein